MKKIIVTGTSRGIGLELAQLFADAGHQVLALSRNTHPSLLRHPNVSSLKIDLADDDSCDSVRDFLANDWKQLDAIVHNAGALVIRPFAELSTDDFLKVYKVNVFGVAALNRVALPYMQKGSHVVTISSMGGIQGSLKFPGLAAYSSSKGAVITLSELLAEEYKDRGIAFNVLALGSVQTEMLAEAFPGYQAPLSAREMAEYIFGFTLNGNKYYNGKVLQVAATTP